MRHTGDKIRILRDIKGYSQESMAQMLGLSRQAYGDIERGKTKIGEARLKQIAEVLGTTQKEIEEGFEGHMANFFEQCNNALSMNGPATQTNYQTDQRELQFELEKSRLEVENLKLQLEKAQLEATLWRERYERGAGSQENKTD
jgi:XRE family transcriptional regulator, regulator of sulfur utilization